MTITYRDSAPASALSEFEERCKAFKVRLQSEDFLRNRGLGNEVGIYTFCYDPRLKAEARRFLDRLKGDPSLPCRIREANLYDILLDICADKRILDAVPKMEEKRGREQLKKRLSSVASAEAFAKRISAEENVPGDVLVITGVGEVYPFMRVHNVLDNIQHLFENTPVVTPVVVMYPGRFDGQTLSLFGKLTDGNYYRAFDLI